MADNSMFGQGLETPSNCETTLIRILVYDIAPSDKQTLYYFLADSFVLSGLIAPDILQLSIFLAIAKAHVIFVSEKEFFNEVNLTSKRVYLSVLELKES